jgi:ribosome-binding factor A
VKVRQLKVAAQIRRLVSVVLPREVHDPRVGGLISVTRVDVSPDLREARVYVSLLGGRSAPSTIMHGLQSAARRVQDQVAESLPLRMAPRLSFHLDDSLKKEAQVLAAIDAATGRRAGEVETPPAPPAPAKPSPRRGSPRSATRKTSARTTGR